MAVYFPGKYINLTLALLCLRGEDCFFISVNDVRKTFPNGMVWYGMVTLFKHGISFRYTFIEKKKTNFLTNLKTKIKEIKLIKMKRKHLLFKEAVCKNRISLVKLFINQNLCLLIFP